MLGGLEEIGATGVLAFRSEAGSGTIRLLHGQIAGDGATEDEERALDLARTMVSMQTAQKGEPTSRITQDCWGRQ